MEEVKKNTENKMPDLKEEIENFKKEKERIRAIVGQIGGIPDFNIKVFNIIFIVFILICLAFSLLTKGILRIVAGELAVFAISIKLVYLMYNQIRMNRFQAWVLSSIEWRLNEIMKAMSIDKNK